MRESYRVTTSVCLPACLPAANRLLLQPSKTDRLRRREENVNADRQLRQAECPQLGTPY